MAPCRSGYWPVYNDMREGAQVGAAANACLNSIDSAANASKCGVFILALPYGPISLTPRSSPTKITILGRSACAYDANQLYEAIASRNTLLNSLIFITYLVCANLITILINLPTFATKPWY